MKRAFLILLSAAFIFVLAACGEKGSAEPSESEIDETLVLAKTQPKTQQSESASAKI